MEQRILIGAYRGEESKFITYNQLIEDGISDDNAFDAMLNMAQELEKLGYYVEMEISYE